MYLSVPALTWILETPPDEQLQFIGSDHCWYQWNICSPAGSDKGISPTSSAEAIHATGDFDGYTEKPFRVSFRLGQHII